MATNPREYLLSVDDYLAQEATSTVKHEYVDGELRAMAGASRKHVNITGNSYLLLRNHLRGSDCDVYFSDMKVQPNNAPRFFYPDVFVSCDPRDRDPDADLVQHFPVLIIEVLSPLTQSFDRGDKLRFYREFPTLREYVLIHTTEQFIECYRRSDGGTALWVYETFAAGDEVALSSIDYRSPIADFYADTDLIAPAAP